MATGLGIFDTIYVLAIVALGIFCIWFIYDCYKTNQRRKALREKIYSEKFFTPEEFKDLWITRRQSQKHLGSGLKYEDCSGCYIFLFFDEPVKDGDYSCYKDVYVGQSIHVFERVRQHLSGKGGNGNIFADLKYGRPVYISIVQCPRDELNYREIELIAAFKATNSYNQTMGGSKVS